MIEKKGLAVAVIAGIFAMVLAACSNPPLPPPASGRSSPTAMVEAIRAAGANDKSVVQVAPLRDPAVDGFLDRAHQAENAGKYQDALDKIDAALKLSPDAPDILQFRAEVEILLRDYPEAAADARRSFALGPKVGGLCASNWQTLLEIAEADNRQADVATARTARDKCHKAGPVRM
ncbi:MAG TPA: tetratricopeptide repeat protein [Rhodanobacteraceae bacterium]|nr:tetratricopeptide repeat protein [Rhodanobacteraceae bacterium]